MKRSIKLVTLFNIPVDINYSWFLILGLVIFTLASGYFPATNPELPALAHWLMAIVAAILLFASLLAHEFSHALVAQRNELPISGITLFVFGGVAHMAKEPAYPGVEFKMAIAGPAMSFTLAVFFFALTQGLFLLGWPLFLLSITNYLFIINLAVGIFNLIPGFPLDGGRVLRAILWGIFKDLKKATGIASSFGKAFAFMLMGLGFMNLFFGSVISGVWFIFIGLFLQEAAEMSYRQVAINDILNGVRVENLMTRSPITVGAEITLDRLVDDYFFRFRYTSFPVVEDDSLLGLVSLHAIKEVEKEKWPQVTARDIMIPLSEALLIDQKAEASEALAKIAAGGLGRLLVAKDNKLIGILSQRDILKLFEFKKVIEK